MSIPCTDAPEALLDPWVHSLMLLGVKSTCFVSQNCLKNLQCFSLYSIHGHVNEWVKQHSNPFAVTQKEKEEKRTAIKQPASKDSKKQRKPICLWRGWDKVKLWNALSFSCSEQEENYPGSQKTGAPGISIDAWQAHIHHLVHYEKWWSETDVIKLLNLTLIALPFPEPCYTMFRKRDGHYICLWWQFLITNSQGLSWEG